MGPRWPSWSVAPFSRRRALRPSESGNVPSAKTRTGPAAASITVRYGLVREANETTCEAPLSAATHISKSVERG